MKLNRNDPCHCGSGKKYKKCHLRSDSERSREVSKLTTARRWAAFFTPELEASMARASADNGLVRVAAEAWGADDMTSAYGDALFRQHALFDVTDPPLIGGATTTTEGDEKRLDSLKAALAESHQSLYEVTECKPGKGIRLADRLGGDDRFVGDAELATLLEPMEVIIGRIARFEERNLLVEGWEKVYFRGRKAAIAELRTQMTDAGLGDDDVEARRAWLQAESPRVTLRARGARPQ